MKFQMRIFFFLLLISSNLLSQQTYGIRGTVSDSLGNAIELGNIILLDPKDSTVLKGNQFWDGTYELLGVEDSVFILKVTSSGYENYHQFFTLHDSITLVEPIRLSLIEQAVGEVEVLVYKPMFERELDRLIVNVEGTLLSDKGSVIDLLRSAPNVIVKSDGSISVVGKGNAIIYIDGRRVNNLEILNSIQSNDVAKIEIIDNPSAKYDAAGNAVIEIKTKKGMLNGYEGQLGVRGMYRTEGQASYWASFGYRKNWFSLQASGYQFVGNWHEDEQYYRQVFGTSITEMENDVEKETFYHFSSGMNVSSDFRVDSLNTIFINYNLSRRKPESYQLNKNLLYSDSVYDGQLQSVSNGMGKMWTHSVSTGYRKEIDTLGSEFRTTLQFTKYTNNNSTDIQQTSSFDTVVFNRYNNMNQSEIGVLTGQADYVKKIGKNNEFSSGIKYTSVSNQSFVDLKQEVNGIWYTDSSTYNTFQYQEQIGAAYAEWKAKYGKFNYLTGLRYEATKMEGSSFVSGSGVINRTYHSLFPTIQMSYHFTDDLILGLNYNYRIARPGFQDMDPFVIFVDSLTAFRGNPQLVPSYTHNAELSLIYMEYASIKLGYQRAIDPMFLTVEKDVSTNTFSAITKNINSSEMYTIALVIPWENSWWTTFNAVGYYFNNFQYADNLELITSKEPTWYVSIYNEFRIPKLFNIELNYEYYNPGTQGFFIARPYQFMMAGISRKFFNDKLHVNVAIYDPLKLSVERAYANVLNFYVDYSSWSDSRNIMMTLRYNFGKLKNNYSVAETIDSDSKNRIKN